MKFPSKFIRLGSKLLPALVKIYKEEIKEERRPRSTAKLQILSATTYYV